MSEVSVYVLHKLGRTGQFFDSKYKVAIERPAHVVHDNYAELINANSNLNGLYYEKDEKATKLFSEGKEFQVVKEYTKFEEVEKSKEELITEYEELSSEKANGTWGVKKLNEEIAKLK